ncbi:MAG: putative phage abortive infection protein [Prevotellaceae bacterium]|jgi:hypothetical protein|nr:putative phage abortive infection protein [Prevotellaceae bacterium]
MKNDNKTFDKLSRWLIGIAITLAIFAFVSPLIFTRNGIVDFSNTGEIGDTIGGIMNPFIGFASIIVMFLAFYMQFKANKMMQSQFERNQFDNQFFEMLKTHKENSNMIFLNYNEGSEEGCGFGGGSDAYSQWVEQRKKGFEYLVNRTNNRYDEWKRQNNSRDNSANFIAAYSSLWEDSFGHYFRHLFLMVKFVVSKPESSLTYEEKRNYLRILRASLSTYEQIFLYYNWLSGYGKKWEDENNKFFTDYRMIYNVNSKIHPDFAIKDTEPFKHLLADENYRKENDRDDDTLFELIE